MGARPPCELCHWGLRRSSLWRLEACEGCAETCGGDACGHRHWSLRWNSLWGHGVCEGCADMSGDDDGLSLIHI
eukprot:938063-Pyramimonas_sp.AAC.1